MIAITFSVHVSTLSPLNISSHFSSLFLSRLHSKYSLSFGFLALLLLAQFLLLAYFFLLLQWLNKFSLEVLLLKGIDGT